MLDPVAVALKFGFIAVLYLFLLWMARSALRDLRSTGHAPVYDPYGGGTLPATPAVEQGTGFYSASDGMAPEGPRTMPKLRVAQAAGLRAGSAYDVTNGALLGRGEDVDIRLQDTFASTRHARLAPHGGQMVLEDLGSTNGTYLNGEPLRGPQPLHAGDRIRIGDSEFSFER